MVPRRWQQIDAARHIRHWWQYRNGHRITAMTFILILLAALFIASVIGTTDALRHDRGAPPRSHHDDLLPPHRHHLA